MFQMIQLKKKISLKHQKYQKDLFASKICAFDRRNFFQYYKTLKSLEI